MCSDGLGDASYRCPIYFGSCGFVEHSKWLAIVSKDSHEEMRAIVSPRDPVSPAVPVVEGTITVCGGLDRLPLVRVAYRLLDGTPHELVLYLTGYYDIRELEQPIANRRSPMVCFLPWSWRMPLNASVLELMARYSKITVHHDEVAINIGWVIAGRRHVAIPSNAHQIVSAADTEQTPMNQSQEPAEPTDEPVSEIAVPTSTTE